MLAMIALLTTAFAGVDAWIEAPWTPVLTAERSPSAVQDQGKIYAAKREFEGFQLVVQGDRRGASQVTVHCTAPHSSIPEPEIFRVAYLEVEAPSNRALSTAPFWPDALIPATPVDLEPGEFAVYWVRFYIPEEARAGIHSAELRIEQERGRAKRIPVRVEVFDFLLPETPEVAILGRIDRPRLRSLGGVDDNLAAWWPFYEVMAQYGLSLSGLPGHAREAIAHGGALLERMPTVELSPPADRLLALQEEGRRTLLSDPLAEYVTTVARGLSTNMSEENGEGEVEKEQEPGVSAILEMNFSERRESWGPGLATLRALQKVDGPVRCIVSGYFHPQLAMAGDGVAVSLQKYSPDLAGHLQTGLPLIQSPSPEAIVSVSSAQAPSAGQDVYDGSPWSIWRPEGGASRRTPAWVLLDLTAPFRLEHLTLLWAPGEEGRGLELETSFDGATFTKSAVKWEHQTAAGPYGISRSTATFRFPSSIVSLRVLFRAGEAIGVQEILLNEKEWGGGGAISAAPRELWLQHDGKHFPSLAVDAHGAEARLLPWVVWHMGFEGATGISLMHWPTAWNEVPSTPPLIWPAMGGDSSAYLFYPGVGQFHGSMRLERLRDGIEDIAYLVALEKAIKEERTDDARAMGHGNRRIQYGTKLSRSELDGMIAYIEKARVEIGRALAKAGE